MTAARVVVSLDPKSTDYVEYRDGLPRAPRNTLPDEESKRRVKAWRERGCPEPTSRRPAEQVPFTRHDIDWNAITRINTRELQIAHIDKMGNATARSDVVRERLKRAAEDRR